MKLPKIFRRQRTLEEAIEHLTIEGYVGQSPDGDFYITQKGLDWYYNEWTDEERRMFNDIE